MEWRSGAIELLVRRVFLSRPIAAAIAVDPSFLQSESEVRVFFSHLFSSSLNCSPSPLTPLTLWQRRRSEFPPAAVV